MKQDILGQLVRFGLVGLGGTLIHLAVAWMANRWGGIAPYTANFAGFAAAFTWSYLGHFYWTFGRRSAHGRHLSRFLVVALAGYGLTNLVIWIVVTRLGHPFEAALGVILIVVPTSTWLLSRIWAFRAPAPDGPDRTG